MPNEFRTARSQRTIDAIVEYQRKIAEILREFWAEIAAILKTIRLRNFRKRIHSSRSSEPLKMRYNEQRVVLARSTSGRAAWLYILRGQPHDEESTKERQAAEPE
ncbi:MAG TPA: hypothetical protein VHR45_20775 [Thermoanaerobaculia bacterium]|nr:hypothetical protein [Thermoanaerobaculia bacterium]